MFTGNLLRDVDGGVSICTLSQIDLKIDSIPFAVKYAKGEIPKCASSPLLQRAAGVVGMLQLQAGACIAQVRLIRECRPRAFLLENVHGACGRPALPCA